MESLKNGYSTVLLPDGPGGPAFVAKKGVLHIALQSGIPMLPIRFQTARVIQLKTWDRKIWPLPFCTIRVQYFEPIWETSDKFDEAYDELTKALG